MPALGAGGRHRARPPQVRPSGPSPVGWQGPDRACRVVSLLGVTASVVVCGAAFDGIAEEPRHG